MVLRIWKRAFLNDNLILTQRTLRNLSLKEQIFLYRTDFSPTVLKYFSSCIRGLCSSSSAHPASVLMGAQSSLICKHFHTIAFEGFCRTFQIFFVGISLMFIKFKFSRILSPAKFTFELFVFFMNWSMRCEIPLSVKF